MEAASVLVLTVNREATIGAKVWLKGLEYGLIVNRTSSRDAPKALKALSVLSWHEEPNFVAGRCEYPGRGPEARCQQHSGC